jgi:hypothetical protein
VKIGSRRVVSEDIEKTRRGLNKTGESGLLERSVSKRKRNGMRESSKSVSGQNMRGTSDSSSKKMRRRNENRNCEI